MLDHLRATAFRRDSITVLVNLPGRLVTKSRDLASTLRTDPLALRTGLPGPAVSLVFGVAVTWLALRRLQADVVVCNTFFDFETTGMIAARQGRRLIWRARADTFTNAHLWQPGRLERLVAFLNDHVDRILATTAYEARMMLDAGVDPRKVHVVRNGVDLRATGASGREQELRREFGVSVEDFCVSFVARMVPQKGYETFFEALAMAKARGVP
jgi:glycosyltransferase involved in cell wall biosynthesis